MKPDLSVKIGNNYLNWPVLTASGTFGYGHEYLNLLDYSRLGAIVTKGLSLQPKRGNPPPRICETAAGMLNAIGLENIGLQRFIQEEVPGYKDLPCPVIVNIFGNTVEEYGQMAAALDKLDDIWGVEVNISCPNIKKDGLNFSSSPESAHQVVAQVRKCCQKPVVVKLSPNVTDIASIAAAVEDAGADAISLINTLLGMAVDLESRRPKLANILGGLSGPAIKPVALRMVWQVCRRVGIPVIGMGGISNWQDAAEFILVGASAIQVGTANFVNPGAAQEITDGLEDYLATHKLFSLEQLRGSLI